MGELGSLLTRAREARGLTIEDAERDTRISRRYLQALEAEHFEVIPAPVYARGFLRSYSQYLGLDPSETLALFPRDEEPSPYYATGTEPAGRPPGQRPQAQPATVGNARPSWRRPSQPQQQAQRQEPPPQPQPQPRQAPRPPQPSRGEQWEPTIGVDIGIPAPARRLKTDPAAQARSMTILIVAVGAIAAVILLALAISRFGDDGGGALGPNTSTATTTAATDETTTPIGSEVTPGIMPEVVGLTEEAALAAIKAAGFDENAISVSRQSHPTEKGNVFDQHPAPGDEVVEGEQAIIAVSEGP